MANALAQQITKDGTIELSSCTHINHVKLKQLIIELLGENAELVYFNNSSKGMDCKRTLIKYVTCNKTYFFTVASITSMGGKIGQHPETLKRLQLKTWYGEFCKAYDVDEFNLKFIGVYSYKDNIVFADFDANTYKKNIMNNSAAHIYINDIYQAMTNGVYRRQDKNGNTLTTVSFDNFKKYLDGEISFESELIAIFDRFNKSFNFGEDLIASEKIIEMYFGESKDWKQGEWPGFYIEHRFRTFIESNNIEKIQFTAKSNKSKTKKSFDFDLFFPNEQFYGDLKSSDIEKKDAPGNDQKTFKECVEQHEKFWYVIFEHESEKDKDNANVEAIIRQDFIAEVTGKIPEKDKISYASKLKSMVNYKSMYIVELNKSNYLNVVKDFKQGKQQNGSPRNLKYILNKVDMQNYIIYKYER